MSGTDKPTFSIGAPSSDAPSSSPFVQASSSGAPPTSNLFGATPTSTSGAPTTSLFGAPAASTTSGAGSSAFGAPSGTASPFGGANKPASAGFSSGSRLETTSAQTLTSTPNLSTPSKTTAPASSAPMQTSNLFGGGASTGQRGGLFGTLASNTSSSAPSGTNTPSTSKPAFPWGNPSTTPAGPPPAGNGGSDGVSSSVGLFKFNNPQSAQGASGIFGAESKPSTTGQQTPTTTAPSNPFGSTPQSSSGNMFAAKSTEPAASEPQAAKLGGSGLFRNLGGSQPSGNLFSGLNKQQENAPPASPGFTPAQSGSSLFQQVSQQAEGNEGPKAANLFGAKSPEAASKSEQSGPSMFSGLGTNTSSTPTSKPSFSFPSTTPAAESKASSTSASAGTSAPASGLFGSLTSTNSTLAPSTSAAATSAPASSLFAGLGQKGSATSTAAASASSINTTSPSSTSAATSSAPAPSFSFPSATAASASSGATKPTMSAPAPSASAATAPASVSTAGPAPPPQSRLKNKSMEDIINLWATDLLKYQKEFLGQAEKVASWDQLLVENGEKIQKLYASTYEAERASSEVERQLSSVEGQQEELSGWLDRYEREVDEMFSRQIGPGETLQGPDQERDRTFKLAEKLSDRLDDMGKDLKAMIEEINSASTTLSKSSKADDPLSQIVKILNSHLSSLQWIDQNAASLQTKISAAQKAGQGMGANGHNVLGDDAADDFYRSFVSRK